LETSPRINQDGWTYQDGESQQRTLAIVPEAAELQVRGPGDAHRLGGVTSEGEQYVLREKSILLPLGTGGETYEEWECERLEEGQAVANHKELR
jgi:hypothetical protein